jgi:hypothetical protein
MSFFNYWNDANILNGETYDGIMVFQIPASVNVVTFSYSGVSSSSQIYNIVWTQGTT